MKWQIDVWIKPKFEHSDELDLGQKTADFRTEELKEKGKKTSNLNHLIHGNKAQMSVHYIDLFQYNLMTSYHEKILTC